MIDMFTILLVFLLKSYSAEGQIMTIARDLRLPKSTATLPPKTTSIVAITREWVLLDGRPIVRNSEVLAKGDLVIPSLLKELQDLRALTEGIGQLGTATTFSGNITIQGDQATPFELLKRVMVTCGRMGYNDMNLAVLRAE
jgi:biopolymer transport protein ExbD